MGEQSELFGSVVRTLRVRIRLAERDDYTQDELFS